MGQTQIIKNADLNISEWTTRLKRSVKTIHPSIFNNLEMKNVLYRLHDYFVLVPADKADNTVAFVCKAHYLNCT